MQSTHDLDANGIGSSVLQHYAPGVLCALKIPSHDATPVLNFFRQSAAKHTISKWEETIRVSLPSSCDSQLIARLTLGVSYFCDQPLSDHNHSSDETNLAWNLILEGIRGGLANKAQVTRSAQGFLVVPFCDLSKDVGLDELFKLHVWLPGGHRAETLFSIPSHDDFARRWVIVGEGMETPYKVESIDNPDQPVPSALRYALNVPPDRFHAILFHSRSPPRLTQCSPVLVPEGESSTQCQDNEDATAQQLCELIERIQSCKDFIAKGRAHVERAQHEYAFRAFQNALNVCTSAGTVLPNMTYYRNQVLLALGETNRRFGRFKHALEIFRTELPRIRPCVDRASFEGEFGTVYRHLGQLEDASAAFKSQYKLAAKFGDHPQMCRALGNMGMVNYQLSLSAPPNKSRQLLDEAFEQLNRRVNLARQQLGVIASPLEGDRQRRYHASAWLLIGLSRLSLCYTVREDHEKAVATSSESLEISRKLHDSTMVGFSRFFHGRALMMAGRPPADYSAMFSPPDGSTPAVSLCKEPSNEHRGYLQELVDAGAVMDRTDPHGYTALDYAVFADDADAERIVLAGIEKRLKDDPAVGPATRMHGMVQKSRIRKLYRVIFQESLRPVLQGFPGAPDVARLREAYATALKSNAAARETFDELRYITYNDFREFGSLPRSSDGRTEAYKASAESKEDRIGPAFLVFISYRWINPDKSAKSPDDKRDKQYWRMCDALEGILAEHPEVPADDLGLWIDYACVDQDDPSSGVNALPLIITQCNAFISLVDEEYYSRAWCCVEVLMAQALTGYKSHHWYEHVQVDTGDGRGILRKSPDIELSMEGKRLTRETDRSAVIFLERQSKLLGLFS